jgi:hypothetical protein
MRYSMIPKSLPRHPALKALLRHREALADNHVRPLVIG